MNQHDPNSTGSYTDGLFGVPTTREDSRVVILPVPWEVTTSYRSGTSRGPLAVWKASAQLDLHDHEWGDAYREGYHLLPIPEFLQTQNDAMKVRATEVREQLERGEPLTGEHERAIHEINAAGAQMAEWVYQCAKATLAAGQIPAVLGGDHSTPEGNIRAVMESAPGQIGILHIDAHADLRHAYQGYTRSHASIMYNVMHADWRPGLLVQVGIRDYCAEEATLIRSRDDIRTHFDWDLKSRLFNGEPWAKICAEIAAQLPRQVYVSFDIDGLSPEFCPNTGTPVPGGLSFDQALFLLSTVVRSGRRIVGFDLNEVAPGPDGSEDDSWDAIVGARVLFKLCGLATVRNPA